MLNPTGARQCFFCQVSTVRGPRRRFRRPINSYLLTEDYIVAHPNVIYYAHSLFGDREITAHDRICRPCLQRADRYVNAERRRQEQAEVELIAQQSAIGGSGVFKPSPGPSSEEQSSDPLSDAPQEIPQNVPVEAPQDVLQYIPEEQEIPQPRNVPVISMPAHKLVSDAQGRLLLDFMQANPVLAVGRVSAQAAPLAKQQCVAFTSHPPASPVNSPLFQQPTETAITIQASLPVPGPVIECLQQQSEKMPERPLSPPLTPTVVAADSSHQRMGSRINIGVPQWALDFENRRLEVDTMLAIAVQQLATAAEESNRIAQATSSAVERLTVAAKKLAQAAATNTELLQLVVEKLNKS